MANARGLWFRSFVIDSDFGFRNSDLRGHRAAFRAALEKGSALHRRGAEVVATAQAMARPLPAINEPRALDGSNYQKRGDQKEGGYEYVFYDERGKELQGGVRNEATVKN